VLLAIGIATLLVTIPKWRKIAAGGALPVGPALDPPTPEGSKRTRPPALMGRTCAYISPAAHASSASASSIV